MAERSAATGAWIGFGLVVVAVGALVLFSGPASADETTTPIMPSRPPTPLVPAPRRVLVVGDSLAVGLCPKLKALATADGSDWAPCAAKVSTRADQWVGQMPGLLSQNKPDLVIVSLGTNDSGMANPAVNRDAFNGIVKAIAASGAKALWLLPPKLPPRLKADLVRQLIIDTGVATFDSRELAIEQAPDGIHPTTGGYAFWADAIWRSVRAGAAR